MVRPQATEGERLLFRKLAPVTAVVAVLLFGWRWGCDWNRDRVLRREGLAACRAGGGTEAECRVRDQACWSANTTSGSRYRRKVTNAVGYRTCVAVIPRLPASP